MSIPNWDAPAGGGSDPDPDPGEDPDSGSGGSGGDPTGPTPTPTPPSGGGGGGGGGSSDPDPDPPDDPDTGGGSSGPTFEIPDLGGWTNPWEDVHQSGTEWTDEFDGYWVPIGERTRVIAKSPEDYVEALADNDVFSWDGNTPVPPVVPGDTDTWGGIDWSGRDDGTAGEPGDGNTDMPPNTDTGSGGGDTDSGWDWDDWDSGTAPPPEDDWWEDPNSVDPDLGDDFPDWFDPGNWDDGTANPPAEPPEWAVNLQDQLENLQNALSNLTDPPAWVEDLFNLEMPSGDGRNLGIAALVAGAIAAVVFWS